MNDREKIGIEREVSSLIARSDEDDDLRKIERAIGGLIEPRRAPNGRILFVPRGTAKDRRSETENYLSVRGIMDWKRKAKRRRYLEKKKDPHYKGPLILGEGDSWLEYPCNKDNGEWIGEDFAFLSLAKAGDTWADIINDENGMYDDGTPMGLFKTVEIEKPHIVILSIGGNDVVEKIEQYVMPYAADREPEDYINDDFELILNFIEYNYRACIKRLISMGCHVLIHSYDYPDPRAQSDGGQWLGGPLEIERGIPGPTLWRGIINSMLTRVHSRLRNIPDDSAFGGKVTLVELFNTIGSDDADAGPDRNLWTDEMHGTGVGFGMIAQRFKEEIYKIAL